ncbi:16S rRNA (cytosine(967)-C(5))-methyltransferase RsmB [Bacillus horti]|uniref:16S rRNA (cytosine(967)-C(5))-methyltransferase n=1 Tax=Caldalkalibacillus horti TaxID=77523 RepID=A0ABT9VXH9_9BACI|nr:16S rRNA (cytosine(967)-C(5))-methyltransferase RsmB [Bacillus horti]MDQ0165700.1 16S rRNA (cytosine967-C5)-methyltransferase [Bacillus horti]
MKATARTIALDALIQIEQGGAYSNLTLQKLLQKNKLEDSRDRHLVTELVYGTIQHQRYIDFLLQPFLKKGVDALDQWVKQLLRVSVYQFVKLDRIPSHAVVHEAVEIAKKKGHRGISGMVNGVLRSFLRTPLRSTETIKDDVTRLGMETSHPDWMIKRWVKQFGWEKTKQLCEDNNRPPQVTIRTNTIKDSRAELIEKLQEEGFEVKETTDSPYGIIVQSGGHVVQSKWFEQGYFTIQDESSMLVAPFVDPKPGMVVLDACAAPGGKTTHLAEYMKDEGSVLAVDMHPHKEKLIRTNINRLGLTCIETQTMDARKLPDARQTEYDRILLDAPCSGLGVIRRKPDLKWKKKETDSADIAAIQYDLLVAVSKLLKPGGQLVYSTCTLEEIENQDVVQKFLENEPSFRQIEGEQKLILPQDFGSDGFYMTKLERIGDEQ